MTTATQTVIPTETCKHLDSTYARVTDNPSPNTKKVVADLLCQLITHTLPHTKAMIDPKIKQYTRLLINTKKGEMLWEVHMFVNSMPKYQVYWPEGTLTTDVRDEWEWEGVDPNYLTSTTFSAALLVILNSQHITAV